MPSQEDVGRVADRVDLVAAEPVLDEVELAAWGITGPEVHVPGTPPGGVGRHVLLRDEESTPVAELAVLAHDGDRSRARLERWIGRPHDLFPDLWRPPAALPDRGVADDVLAVVADRPLLGPDVDALRAESGGRPVLLLALAGAGRSSDRPALLRSLRTAAAALHGRDLVAVPVPGGSALSAEGVGAAYGAAEVVVAAATDQVWLEVSADRGRAAGLVLPGTESEVARLAPLPSERGVVVLLTGLSGSGKSTLARSVAARLEEVGDRRVTLLDGDVVRRELSAGLGFDRADRERNVRRIGWVAAEVGRHGGVAVACPIAPYASTRAQVRALAAGAGARFLLVHVSTPLEVCEARDPKGLYARARAGLVPHFTGVSDPYEPPDDADLAIDTSVVPLAEATAAVLAVLDGVG